MEDYYLAEGTEAFAQRYTVDSDGHVIELARMDGDAYEAWVAGVDPETAEPRGRLRHDARAVRFVEVAVNGPKSWSLAAELHPDIAAAYDAAQDRAAKQIIGWLGQHATTRVGPRGQQVAIRGREFEAVTVRHYTSRAGDPHRHLHLQINARVFAEGSVAGAGHRRDPGLDRGDQRDRARRRRDRPGVPGGAGRARLHPRPGQREITQLAPYVGAFSERAAQIERNIDRYESAWRVDTSRGRNRARRCVGRGTRGRGRRAGRTRSSPTRGADVRDRWLDELHALGYRDPRSPDAAAHRTGRGDRP